MTVLNPKEEIVSLLRGYFTCPLISFLGKRGILNKMIFEEFAEDEFKEIVNKEIFHSILVYFESIGLLEKSSHINKYRITEIGKKIFKRYGSFCLLHSYGFFLNLLENILFDKNYKEIPKVNRLENIIGSGQTNNRKYFPSAIEMLKGKNSPFMVIDIGCGDGTFLNLILKSFPNCHVVGVDVSEEALEETEKNLKRSFDNVHLKTILRNGKDVSRWLLESIKDYDKEKGSLIISMWYFIHEISQKEINVVVAFLNEIYKIAPFAELIIGEITSITIEVLIKNKYESIMPEYLFFHEISGQGVLSWQAHKDILKRGPYRIKNEKLFDILKNGNENIPSGFIWHLTPREG